MLLDNKMFGFLHMTSNRCVSCNGFSKSSRITMLSASQRISTPFSKRVAVKIIWLTVSKVSSPFWFCTHMCIGMCERIFNYLYVCIIGGRGKIHKKKMYINEKEIKSIWKLN